MLPPVNNYLCTLSTWSAAPWRRNFLLRNADLFCTRRCVQNSARFLRQYGLRRTKCVAMAVTVPIDKVNSFWV
jgi:hypothetical protein